MTARRIVAVSLVALAFLTSTGCNFMLEARSPAPPARTAHLDELQGFWDVSYLIEVSRGVALAITCYAGPCHDLRLATDDPAIAEVRPATLATLEHAPWSGAPRPPPPALVVIGKTAGTTVLHVASGKHHRDIPVRVVPAPEPALAVAP
jgi:hypothetical protein